VVVWVRTGRPQSLDPSPIDRTLRVNVAAAVSHFYAGAMLPAGQQEMKLWFKTSRQGVVLEHGEGPLPSRLSTAHSMIQFEFAPGEATRQGARVLLASD
jgi:hypothetical protein